MGDVVQISEVRRARRRRRSETEVSEGGTVALFTGVRIERWGDPETDPGEPPRNRTTPSRRRRRRT